MGKGGFSAVLEPTGWQETASQEAQWSHGNAEQRTKPKAVMLFKPSPVGAEPYLLALRQMAHLQPGWDSYGGVVPSSQVLQRAKRWIASVIEELDHHGLALPMGRCSPTSSGDIGFNWRRHGTNLAVLVPADLGEEAEFLISRAGQVIDSGEWNFASLPGLIEGLTEEHSG